MENTIYLDYAATTPVEPSVLEAMLPYFKERFGNASSAYSLGAQSRKAVERARCRVADLLNAMGPGEIYFTSGGTESDNWALSGAACANREHGNHIITTPIEHHAVLASAHWLERAGFEVTLLPVDTFGMVDPDDLRKAIRSNTTIISIMHANNEIGTIQPIADLAKVAHEHGILFHTDSVQTVGKIPVDVRAFGVDLLSISGHKLYGPKGIGALYIKNGVTLDPLISGGGQEKSMRGGTYNVPGIVGIGKACELAKDYLNTEIARQQAMRDNLIDSVLNTIPDSRLNGHPTLRLPHNAHFAFKSIEGSALVANMEAMGVYCSAGSACSSGATSASHVLTAIGLPSDWVRGTVRMTLGKPTTSSDIQNAAKALAHSVSNLRRLKI